MKRLLIAGILVMSALVAYTQLGIFVVQPIGAIPDGRTVIVWRRSAILNFVDSADGICLRTQDGVSLLCRLGVLAGVVNNNPILLRLPYSESLYLASTGGRSFVR